MKSYNGIKLQYRYEPRQNYMSLSDLVWDLSNESLIELLKSFKKLDSQMIVMKQLEQRDEIDYDYLMELLESCDGE